MNQDPHNVIAEQGTGIIYESHLINQFYENDCFWSFRMFIFLHFLLNKTYLMKNLECTGIYSLLQSPVFLGFTQGTLCSIIYASDSEFFHN